MTKKVEKINKKEPNFIFERHFSSIFAHSNVFLGNTYLTTTA